MGDGAKRSETIRNGDGPPWAPVHAARGAAERAPRPAEIEQLAELAIDGDLNGAVTFVSNVIDDGVSTESVLLHLVAPTARLLGNQWDDEARDFADVVKGLDVLRQLIHILKLSSKS